MPSKNNVKLSKQREIDRKRIKKRKVKLVIISILIIISGTIAYLLNSETFFLKNIEIIGNSQLSTEEIINQSGITKGKSIFTELSIVSKVKLKQNGYIKDAKIRKKLPDTIIIEVEEREKEFQIKTEEDVYIDIDEQGYIVDVTTEKQDLIMIEGIELTKEQAMNSERLSNNDLNVKFENILHIKENAQKIGIYSKITEIQIQIQNEYIVKLGNDEITINLGNCTNLKNKMFYVKAILEQEVGNKGIINVNGNLNEGFIPYFTEN